MDNYQPIFDDAGNMVDFKAIIGDRKNFIITIDTRDWCYIIYNKENRRRTRHPELTEDQKSEWLTIDEVIERIKTWRDKKFIWSRDLWHFKYVSIFWDKRGYSWCDKNHYHLPGWFLCKHWDYNKPVEQLETERWSTTKVDN